MSELPLDTTTTDVFQLSDAYQAAFFNEWKIIWDRSDWADPVKADAFYRLYQQVLEVLTSEEDLRFYSSFSRLSYACRRAALTGKLCFLLHQFRRASEGSNKLNFKNLLQLGAWCTAKMIEHFGPESLPTELKNLKLKPPVIESQERKTAAFYSQLRVYLHEDDPSQAQFVAEIEDLDGQLLFVKYNEPDRNDLFNPTIKLIREQFGFPLTVNLLDVELDEDGVLYPKAFVVEPDYLVDVSAITSAWNLDRGEPALYFLNRWLPKQQTLAILLGNAANLFLDELMSDPTQEYPDLIKKVFSESPLAFIGMSDHDVRDFYNKGQRHYVSLKTAVLSTFPQKGIHKAGCFLEPSFYSEKYGIQGRLDVFYRDAEQAIIVELKSGSLYQANRYKINPPHFLQTLLYDALIESVYGTKRPIVSYIFYSKLEQDQLRYAPRVRERQFEALQVRNQLLAVEYAMAKWTAHEPAEHWDLTTVNTQRFPHFRGFSKTDLQLFEKVIQQLRPLDIAYFRAFGGFIAREQLLSKLGTGRVDGSRGFSGLWRTSRQQKEEGFQILGDLELIEDAVLGANPYLKYRKTEATNKLANFRVGDIVVVYPVGAGRASVLHHQVFKGTLSVIEEDTITVQLRFKQFNDQLFKSNVAWNIEHDQMDVSFRSMYRALFAFAHGKEEKRQLWLGERPPNRRAAPSTPVEFKGVTTEQAEILNQIIVSEEYFLLWGPPGSGKTSVVLKNLVAHLLDNTDERLVLLAFTNRAVDEICAAIESIRPEIIEDYLRLGGRHSCGEQFKPQLLNAQIKDKQRREDLIALLQNKRILVSTVSSFQSKTDLLKVVGFDRVLIDEASQLLEPMILGILPHFAKALLIGDHLQLPAVSQQSAEQTAVEHEGLTALGLTDMRTSLFERLYRLAKAKNWNWAYAQLSFQGRMHREIMAFPAEHFYHGKLNILPIDCGATHQTEPLNAESFMKERVAFFHVSNTLTATDYKINQSEAELVADVVLRFQEESPDLSIGIITPYRAQIAQIRHSLNERLPHLADRITVDTVERYQGGARDIIILSLCVNMNFQLASIQSTNLEGIDRKLNVALTRARKRLLVFGDKEVLKQDPYYRLFVESYERQLLS